MDLRKRALVGIFCLLAVQPLAGPRAAETPPNWIVEECQRLAEVLADYLAAPGHIPQWGDYEYARYTAGRLSQLGYTSFLARAGDEWWVVVRLSHGEETYYVPVLPGIASERSGQPRGFTLGSIAGSVGAESLHLNSAFLAWEELLELPPNIPPVALIRGPRRNYKVNEVVMLFGVSSFDPDGVIVRFIWDFGDGEHDWGMNVSHKYKKAGTYEVTLRVIDEGGIEAQAKRTIVILPEGEKPTGGGCGCGG